MKFVYSLEEEMHRHGTVFKELFGAKAYRLYLAKQFHAHVPQTWLISSEAYDLFLQEHPGLESTTFYAACLAFLKKHFDSFVLGLNIPIYAVRSSAIYEEDDDLNYSGIFETFLSVKKTDLLLYIAKVWASLFSKRKEAAKMGVIIQPMIFEKIAGICFSKHPNPSIAGQEEFMVIEYAKTGEIGDVTKRFDIIDLPDKIKEKAKEKWIVDLVDNILNLSKNLATPIYAEFLLDEEDVLWLILQKPWMAKKNVLDLTSYKREKKGDMAILNVEMLIDGVCKFLPPYLEFHFKLDPWIVMTTDEEEQRELWIHERYEEAILEEVRWKIQTDPSYLNRILARYESYHKLSTSLEKYYNAPLPLRERFKSWWDLMLLLSAHEKVPFLLLEALKGLLLAEMSKIDVKSSLSDLTFIGTYEVGGADREKFDRLIVKYCVFARAKEYFKIFRAFHKILKEKNSVTEIAKKGAAPLFEQLAKKLGTIKSAIWEMGFEEIMICFHAKSATLTQKLEFSHKTILRIGKKMLLSSQIKVVGRH